MKIFNLLFFILFLFSAALQYNDPDPYIWIPIYLYGAILCWLAFRKKFYPTLYIIGIIAFFGYAMYFLFTKDGVLDWMREHNSENIVQSMKATKPWIEATREFLGLIHLIIAMSGNLIYSNNVARRTRRTTEDTEAI